MDKISRQEAIEKGLTHYYTGNPCKHGHVSKRYTSTHSCVECTKNTEDTSRTLYREKNRQKIRETARKWRENNREHVRQKLKEWHARNPYATDYKNNDRYKEQRIAIAKRFRDNNPIKALLINKRAWCKRHHIDFNLQEEDIRVPELCPVLGIPLIWGGGIKSDYSPSLDRLDPHGGYTRENVQVISWRANNLKSNGTIREFEFVLQYLYDHSRDN